MRMKKIDYLASRQLIIQPSAWLRRSWFLLLIIALLVSLAISYNIIDDSTDNLSLKPKKILTLLAVNIGIIALVIAIIATRIYGLWRALRASSGGSRLQKRIVIMFSLVTITPAIIVSVFSALFFNIGIQSWFNERVQRTVEESRAVAEAYLNEHKENIRGDAIAMAGDLSHIADLAITNPAEFSRNVAAQASLRVLTEAVVIQRNRIIAQGRFSFALAFETLPQDALERAAKGEAVILTSENDKVRALTKIPDIQDAYLLVGRLIDSKVINHMQNAQGAVSEYENLRSQLDRLQVTFSVVFVTLALLLLLSSVWYGMVFAARLTRPIRHLVRAAERVRGGDFSARIEDASSKDELGTLSRAFNRMTEQLEAQRTELIEANRRLDERRRFSETVLSGVSAGVIALARNKTVSLYNRSSTAILDKVDRLLVEGEYIANILPDIEELLRQAESLPDSIAERTINVFSATNSEKSLTLHVRVTVEHLGAEIEGFIVTFDDITPLVAAQRNEAWADVARRVAHEIKNPLTPIQLSAERIKRKYLPFITEDKENFIKYTDTISKHVADIGKMVDEFVSFARMPTTRFMDEDIVAIVKKSVFSAQVACPNYEFALSVPDTPVFLRCDERQITQVMTNLLKNAAEAIDEAVVSCGQREEKGRIKVGVIQNKDALNIIIEDNGIGFDKIEIGKALEPYVTTRAKGTGLGLSIVKKIVEDHKGTLKIENGSNGGARVIVSFAI